MKVSSTMFEVEEKRGTLHPAIMELGAFALWDWISWWRCVGDY